MALWDRVKTALAIQPTYDDVRELQVRNIADMDMGSSTVSDLLLRSQGLLPRAWRAASIREALGVPAIFRAVTLISGAVGSLGVEAYRKGVLLSDDDTPRLIQRPDPFRIPRDFYRDTAFDFATRGEFWWWIAKRDADGNALSLIRVPPWEITVEANNFDRLRPKILWLGREIPRDDIRQGTFQLDDSGLRGVGPLQRCGAAVSVAVESQEWAANFFAEDGGYPSLVIKTVDELGQDENGVNEADTLRDQWMSKPHNTPRIIDSGIESVEEFGANVQSGQMLAAREFNKGDAANIFGIPGELLEYGRPGSSLVYQNVAEIFTRFVKTPLAPDYLEPIEQHMSDLLPRSTVARFNVKGFMRADAKTRWEVYQIAAAVLGQEEAATLAREQEGLAPGDVEFAPVPFAPPQAVPDLLPINRDLRVASQDGAIHDWRCSECGRKLAESAGPGTTVRCRCKAVNTVPLLEVRTAEAPQREPIIITPSAPTITVHPAAAPNVSTSSPVTFAPGSIQIHNHMPKEGAKRFERDADKNLIRIVPEEEPDGVVAQ